MGVVSPSVSTSRQLSVSATSSMARMFAFTVSDSVGHASTTRCKPASDCIVFTDSAPENAPPSLSPSSGLRCNLLLLHSLVAFRKVTGSSPVSPVSRAHPDNAQVGGRQVFQMNKPDQVAPRPQARGSKSPGPFRRVRQHPNPIAEHSRQRLLTMPQLAWHGPGD